MLTKFSSAAALIVTALPLIACNLILIYWLALP